MLQALKDDAELHLVAVTQDQDSLTHSAVTQSCPTTSTGRRSSFKVARHAGKKGSDASSLAHPWFSP